MVFMAIGIGLLDSFCTFVLKENIQRLRPCKAHEWVNVVYKCGGLYGYVSNHAANGFAFATLMTLFLKGRFAFLFILLLL